jgi:TorA maturation chaperone TorD
MTDENNLWRAQTYALLATLLAKAPEQNLLDDIAQIEVTEPDSPMGRQWLELIKAVKQVDAAKLYDEYHQLFIGVTHGELMPYGSYYQTGFLMEEPLAMLRNDLAKLGLQRNDEVSEPEDHIAAQCDVMRLILMAEGEPIVTAADFFKANLEPWVKAFFKDLAQAQSAQFYQSVAKFATEFFQLECSAYQ